MQQTLTKRKSAGVVWGITIKYELDFLLLCYYSVLCFSSVNCIKFLISWMATKVVQTVMSLTFILLQLSQFEVFINPKLPALINN